MTFKLVNKQFGLSLWPKVYDCMDAKKCPYMNHPPFLQLIYSRYGVSPSLRSCYASLSDLGTLYCNEFGSAATPPVAVCITNSLALVSRLSITEHQLCQIGVTQDSVWSNKNIQQFNIALRLSFLIPRPSDMMWQRRIDWVVSINWKAIVTPAAVSDTLQTTYSFPCIGNWYSSV